MGIRDQRLTLLVFSACLTFPIHSIAQEQPAAQDNPASSTNKKDSQRREKKLAKEMGPAYGFWLRDEVPDIITEDERRAFLGLSTNEEREQFIEVFWNRRNPEPESPTNSVREEHYRRLAYADERFASGIPGRKTDRGRIYIIWGPPDEIESHPTGGTYERPLEQGGAAPTRMPGNCGVTVIWKTLAKTLRSNL